MPKRYELAPERGGIMQEAWSSFSHTGPNPGPLALYEADSPVEYAGNTTPDVDRYSAHFFIHRGWVFCQSAIQLIEPELIASGGLGVIVIDAGGLPAEARPTSVLSAGFAYLHPHDELWSTLQAPVQVTPDGQMSADLVVGAEGIFPTWLIGLVRWPTADAISDNLPTLRQPPTIVPFHNQRMDWEPNGGMGRHRRRDERVVHMGGDIVAIEDPSDVLLWQLVGIPMDLVPNEVVLFPALRDDGNVHALWVSTESRTIFTTSGRYSQPQIVFVGDERSNTHVWGGGSEPYVFTSYETPIQIETTTNVLGVMDPSSLIRLQRLAFISDIDVSTGRGWLGFTCWVHDSSIGGPTMFTVQFGNVFGVCTVRLSMVFGNSANIQLASFDAGTPPDGEILLWVETWVTDYLGPDPGHGTGPWVVPHFRIRNPSRNDPTSFIQWDLDPTAGGGGTFGNAPPNFDGEEGGFAEGTDIWLPTEQFYLVEGEHDIVEFGYTDDDEENNTWEGDLTMSVTAEDSWAFSRPQPGQTYSLDGIAYRALIDKIEVPGQISSGPSLNALTRLGEIHAGTDTLHG